MAFAYFSKAGWNLLEGQHSVLEHDSSFLVVSVDLPTNLEALAEVAIRYPGTRDVEAVQKPLPDP